MRSRWLAVMPIKPLPSAKTRLRGAVPGVDHLELVLAMAQDTVAAALASDGVERVVVVCDDPTVRTALDALGAHCVPDRPAAGLNAALVYAARDERGPVAALTADLPALRPVELAAALALASTAPARAYVPDRAGTGTVLLTAPAGTALEPGFGPDSAAAHRASGARELAGDWPGLRTDVDTAADLRVATGLGLGPHTEALLWAASAQRR
jgi:2-phospho-L-lactate guanylyltransferase